MRRCDAENVARYFAAEMFDLVFSSNLLEHLSSPSAALRGIHEVLRDEGITLHVMPNPLWKLLDFTFFYADVLRQLVRRLRHGGSRNEADRKSTRLNSSHSQISYAVFCLKKKTNH